MRECLIRLLPRKLHPLNPLEHSLPSYRRENYPCVARPQAHRLKKLITAPSNLRKNSPARCFWDELLCFVSLENHLEAKVLLFCLAYDTKICISITQYLIRIVSYVFSALKFILFSLYFGR